MTDFLEYWLPVFLWDVNGILLQTVENPTLLAVLKFPILFGFCVYSCKKFLLWILSQLPKLA